MMITTVFSIATTCCTVAMGVLVWQMRGRLKLAEDDAARAAADAQRWYTTAGAYQETAERYFDEKYKALLEVRELETSLHRAQDAAGMAKIALDQKDTEMNKLRAACTVAQAAQDEARAQLDAQKKARQGEIQEMANILNYDGTAEGQVDLDD